MELYTYVLIVIIFVFCMSSAVLSFMSKNEMDKFEKDKSSSRKEQAKKYSKWAMYAGIAALVILVIYGILFLWIGGKFSSFGSAVKKAWNNPVGGNNGDGGDGNGNGGGGVGGNVSSSPQLIEEYSGTFRVENNS